MPDRSTDDALTMAEQPQSSATFLFTDIEGSTRLVEQLGDRYGAVLSEHHRLLREAFTAHGGEEVDNQGDAFFFVFQSARAGAEAAAAAQTALAAHAWPEGAEFRVRMGMNTGEASRSPDGRFHGLSIHRGARVVAAAHGGQVLVSRATASALTDEGLDGIELRDLGEYRLKDFETPERIYQLTVDGLDEAFPPLHIPSARATAAQHLRYRLLGPLEVEGEHGLLPLGGAKQRALLVLLLLNANRVVSREKLIDDLWEDDPPETAVTSVQVYISRLRKVLPPGALVTRAPGYLLEADPLTIDANQFETLVGEARSAEPEQASQLLAEALGLWRGEPLAEFEEQFARIEGGRLEDQRLAVLEQRIDADLALGRHAELIGELEVLIAEHPHRERLRGQLMLALYRAGRQAEALDAYRAARGALDELGLEPSADLRELERGILTQDLALEPTAPMSRKTVQLPGPLRGKSPFPFVGRDKEVSALRAALALAERGEGGQVVLIGGEAGSGKTRLARELAADAAERGTFVLYGSCNPEANAPYQPFVDAVHFLARVSEPAALDDLVRPVREDLAPLLPRSTASTDVAAGDPDVARQRLHNGVSEVIARIAREQALLAIVDDIHWADTASIELLRHLVRTVSEARVCLVITHRDRSEDMRPELSAALADLARLEGVTRVRLEFLSSNDIDDFVARWSGSTPTEELTDALVSLTRGTPFLLCELWRALNDAGTVENSDAGVRLTRPPAELSSPDRVQEVVSYRISRLAPATRAMLEVASVAGPRFELDVLGDRDSVVAGVAEAVESGMIEALSETGSRFRFTHELVRRALYDRLPSIRRAQLHLHVGKTIESRHGDDLDRFAVELAHHFTLATPVAGAESAITYNLRAAEVAIASLAFDDAVARLSTVLELDVTDDVQRINAELRLGAAYLQMGKVAEAEAVSSRACRAAARQDDARLRARAVLMRAYVRLRTDPTGVFEATQAAAEEAIETFTRCNDDKGLADAWRLLSRAHGWHSHWRAVEEANRRALEHAEAVGDQQAQSAVLHWLVVSLYYGPTRVVDAIRECEALRRERTDDRALGAITASLLSGLYAMTGRVDDARIAAHESISELDHLGLRVAAANARIHCADAALLTGDIEAAEQLLLDAHEMLDRAGDNAGALTAAMITASFLCFQDRCPEAVHWAVTSRPHLEQSDVMTCMLGFSVEAQLAIFAGRLAEAEQAARRAVELGQCTDALNDQASAWLVLNRVLAAAGRASESRRAHAEALGLYRAKGNLAAIAQTREPAAFVVRST